MESRLVDIGGVGKDTFSDVVDCTCRKVYSNAMAFAGYALNPSCPLHAPKPEIIVTNGDPIAGYVDAFAEDAKTLRLEREDGVIELARQALPTSYRRGLGLRPPWLPYEDEDAHVALWHMKTADDALEILVDALLESGTLSGRGYPGDMPTGWRELAGEEQTRMLRHSVKKEARRWAEWVVHRIDEGRTLTYAERSWAKLARKPL